MISSTSTAAARVKTEVNTKVSILFSILVLLFQSGIQSGGGTIVGNVSTETNGCRFYQGLLVEKASDVSVSIFDWGVFAPELLTECDVFNDGLVLGHGTVLLFVCWINYTKTGENGNHSFE